MASKKPMLDTTKLVGQTSRDGSSGRAIDGAPMSSPRPAPLPKAVSDLKAADLSEDSSSGSDVEDYDKLKLDLTAVVAGSKGGGMDTEHALRVEEKDDFGIEGIRTPEGPKLVVAALPEATSPTSRRRKSIQVILEKTDKRGRYILTADDPDIREILRNGIEREAAESASATGKKPRAGFRELVFTRQFTTFDRQNPRSSQTPFYGFFTLFWLAIALLLLRVGAQNYRIHGSVLGRAELIHMMFDRAVIDMGLTDGVLVASTVVGLLLQKLVAKGYINWNRSGWIIQNIWQTCYLAAFVGWTFYREWPWTHTVFIVLHTLVFLMKQHSYAFYNGYLSQVYRRKKLLQQKLHQLEQMSPLSSPITSPVSPTASFSTSIDALKPTSSAQRRGSKASTNLHKEQSQIATIASAIESGSSLSPDQMEAFSRVIRSEIVSLDAELRGKCTSTSNYYPSNLTLSNFVDWTCLPTLVYELEYPRQESINWYYVLEKTAATFGVIWVMIVVSQAYIYPLVLQTLAHKAAGASLGERWQEFPWILSDMLFPLLLEQLLSWYVIWECALNVLAELTRFADRGFYGDWWNAVSWDAYARDWNRPVHNFLLRHVYHSSISAFHLSKSAATFVTFLLSACVHELVMFCLFKKVRGYLFALQLCQIPLAALSRTKLLKGRDVLGNLIFWLGLFVGPSVLFSLYLIV